MSTEPVAYVPLVSADEAASYIGTSITAELTTKTDLANRLIHDSWASPVSPTPAHVRALTLTVIERAVRNPMGLSSWTRSWDDMQRTERTAEQYQQAGIFLTPAELDILNPVSAVTPRRVNSIRLRGRCW